MGKYSKKTNKKNTIGGIALLVTVILLLAALVWIVATGKGQEGPGSPTEEIPETSVPAATGEQEWLPVATEPKIIELTDGLQILHISSYAGIYMEDGSGEVVSDVMMLVLENTSDRDLQLVRISMEYSDYTAEFEVTNLPAGEKVVALERNRHPEPEEDYVSVQTRNLVFFAEPMNLQEERIRITGRSGSLEVENISGEAITGDIYIYYKHSASDLLYGGITYRVSVRDGLEPGEKVSIAAGHYTADGCRILLVDCGD